MRYLIRSLGLALGLLWKQLENTFGRDYRESDHY